MSTLKAVVLGLCFGTLALSGCAEKPGKKKDDPADKDKKAKKADGAKAKAKDEADAKKAASPEPD